MNDVWRDAKPRLPALLAEIEGVPFVDDPQLVRRRSRDFFWYSPILNEQLTASPPT